MKKEKVQQYVDVKNGVMFGLNLTLKTITIVYKDKTADVKEIYNFTDRLTAEEVFGNFEDLLTEEESDKLSEYLDDPNGNLLILHHKDKPNFKIACRHDPAYDKIRVRCIHTWEGVVEA